MKSRLKKMAPDAVVAYANHLTVAPGISFGEYHVMSRMLLWCQTGEGNVTVNGDPHILRSGDMLFLPWGHRISYFNGSRKSWRISGIHIIPELPHGSPFECKVRHAARDQIKGGSLRKDYDLGKVLKGVVKGTLLYPGSLSHLAEYTIGLFVRGMQTEQQCRLLALLLLQEIEYNILNPQVSPANLPFSLVKICEYIENRLEQKITLRDLMKAGGISQATVCRLFSHYLRTRPFEWINHQRIEKAAELLIASDLRVGEIAHRVGIGDQYYFSKLFSGIKGVPPGVFRQENATMI